ncbi:unnamed protein product [Vitrella brassicaformis CCMP3155]|uniref:Enoyl reductase (ER) domain-containing protein n=2 Tax=Vitrella brassicaformis TaxID=1169539 RepID=A0A0G4FTJ4_VITBC|nr:unnamed protein product [Vitrella brassicaformis CCMP3155]|eukprot:CEM18259.1 unnamed protein product [Vitrella brassicaformis CCMP3155]
MAPLTNRRWVLARDVKGKTTEGDFRRADTRVDDAQLKDGEVMLKQLLISFDPAQRTWLTDSSYVTKIKVGEVMRAISLSRVVASKHPDWQAGDLVRCLGGWQDYLIISPDEVKKADAIADPKERLTRQSERLAKVVLPPGVPMELGISLFGVTGLTAYVGLVKVGRVKEGQTVLVSAAAGATGSVVGQLAKAYGAKTVVGIAGGPEKCKFLVETLGFDAAIDYKSQETKRKGLRRCIMERCPEGVDLFFDNVGGETLEAGISCLREFGTVVLCGAIGEYQKPSKEIAGIRNYFELVKKSARVEGFLVPRFASSFGEAVDELGRLSKSGQIHQAHDIQAGFESLPKTFIRLFEGRNTGKLLCKL